VNELTGLITPTLGAGGILVLVVLMVLRGLLVPRSTLDMVREEKDKQIATWQLIAEKAQELNAVQAAQIDALMSTTQTTRSVLEAVGEAARLNRAEGGGAREEVPAVEG
jgi:hypothetical protein